jgi:hypothetical protein
VSRRPTDLLIGILLSRKSFSGDEERLGALRLNGFLIAFSVVLHSIARHGFGGVEWRVEGWPDLYEMLLHLDCIGRGG